MRIPRLSPLLLAAAVVTGCAHQEAASFSGPLDEAAQSARSGKAEGRTLALAGFRAWLLDGKLDAARPLITQALQKDPKDPYALFAGLMLARHDGHPEKALTFALDLCEQNPTHPLCVPAARYAGELSGRSASTDQLLMERGQRILSRGATGDTGFLLRNAMASVLREKPDPAALRSLLGDSGAPTTWTVVGPLSAYHALSFDDAPDVLKTFSLAGPFQGPFGAVQPRTLSFPAGQLDLAGEPITGDFYVAAVDFTVPTDGTYIVRTVSADSLKGFVDGEELFERRGFSRSVSTVNAQGIALSAGKHRLLLQLNKPDRGTYLMVTVERPDGAPSGIHFEPAQGEPPKARAPRKASVANVFPTAQDLAHALEPEVGTALADWIAGWDAMGRNPDGSEALADALSQKATGPAVSMLSAEIDLHDPSVPDRVSNGRATRDLEATLAKDPKNVEALLAEAELAIADGRIPEAETLAQRAEEAYSPVGAPVRMLEARVQLALGLDARADQKAQAALEAQPSLCEAISLRYDLANKHDAVQKADALLGELKGCPHWMDQALLHAKVRGDTAQALALAQSRAALHPENLSTVLDQVSLLVGQKRYDDALAVLAARLKDWPRNFGLAKRVGEIDALAGREQDALKAREYALTLGGGDLSLRRLVARQTTGQELLQDLAVNGMDAIHAYEAKAPHEDAASTLVLDAAATQAYPDGSQVDRIHTITKVLDQSAVSDVAEVSLPAGAQVLALRTIKPDGRVLEPEQIENKDTISMPGVEVGDYVEEEFLLEHPPRSPMMPGWTASNFYFQVARTPDHWATYVVRGPKSSHMGVDAHNLKPAPITTEGDQQVFRYEVRDSPPYIPEPDSPPMLNEYLPFVVVGSGATGEEPLVQYYSDTVVSRSQVTYEVERFARKAAAGKTGLEAVKAVVAAVDDQIDGTDQGFGASAAASVAQSRGSRLTLLKASLDALGIPARLVAVRTFNVDPSHYVYPSDALLPYFCLRVDLPDQAPLWVDTVVRYGPLGRLPEQAANGREAFVFAEPGKPLERVTTPTQPEKEGKQVELTLSITPDGALSGEGVETYTGFDAAQISNALATLSPNQRDQALQSALSRYFGGADLSSVKVDMAQKVGAPVTVRYQFTASNYARKDGPKLTLGSLTFPAYLGRRYVEVGARTTPLFIDSTERSETHVRLTLPQGMTVANPLGQPVSVKSPYGHYSRAEQLQGNVLDVKESYALDMNRIPVKSYDAFSQFAGEVDLVQSREITLAPGAATAAK